MRYAALASVTVLGLGAAAWRTTTTRAAEVETPAVLAPAAPVAADAPVQPVVEAPIVPPPPPPAEASGTPRVREVSAPRTINGNSGRRFRNTNRYPGPIPTPADWKPPEGPIRIALQAGHWKANEAPPELDGLKDNGTRWGSILEWEANLAIAKRAAELLTEKGYTVDVLPAVVPPGYRAHLFIAIHADGSNDPAASGFRVASPRQDATGRAERAATLLEAGYKKVTGMNALNTVTRRMTSYYAFNFRRYEHALHPMTIGVILETGFLTSAKDRAIIIGNVDRAARGIVEGVMAIPETALVPGAVTALTPGAVTAPSAPGAAVTRGAVTAPGAADTPGVPVTPPGGGGLSR